MMNEFQRRILTEAAKFGGAATSKNEQMAKAINEAPLFATGGGGTMFGYSKQQFEAKMRQLIQKMGFEKGINKMEVSDKKMLLYFANAAKARDFIITFNGLTKRQATGSPASINTSFDKVKAPAGTNAIVTVDFSMLKTEGLDRESHLFLMLESLHEEYITEGAVKAAMEDWVEGLPKAVVAEIRRKYAAKLKAAEMKGLSANDPIRKELKQLLDKNKVAPAMGDKSRESDIAALEMMFNTFHGESVEVKEEVEIAEQFKAGDKVKVPHKGKMVSGKIVRYDDGGTDKARQHGGGYVVDVGEPASVLVPKQKVQKEEVEEIEEAKVKYLTGPGKKDSKRLIGIYTMGGKWVKDMNSENEAKAFVNKSWGESVEEDGEELTEAQQVIGKYRFTSFTEGSLKGWLISVQNKGEVGFIEEPAKKNTRTSVAPHKVFFNTKQQGNPKMVLSLFPDSTTRFVGDKEMRFAPRQLLKAVAMWMDKHGMSMVESFDISEVWWKGTDTLSKSDADGLLDDLEKAYERGGLNGTFKVPNGDSGPVWEMIQGLEDFLRGEPKNMVAYVLKGVKDFLKPEDRNNSKIKAVFESFTEAYAPLDTKGIVGAFTEATKKKRFEYRNSTDSWGKSHGLPHEVCVSYGGDRKEQWRAANVKGTVCYIATDEGEGGKPVLEKWAIRNHVKYVKAEETEQEGEVIEEQDRVSVQGSKMVYVGQRLRALQSKSMMSGSVVKGENYKVATNAKGKVDLVHQAIGYRTAVRNVDATTIEALIKDRVLT